MNPPDDADLIAAALARVRGRRPGPDGHERGPSHREHHDHRGPHGPVGPGPGRASRFAGLARFRLLEALSAAEAPLSVVEIADAVGVDQPRASRLVQQCVELGLVQREADPDDARRTRIALTEQGAEIARRSRAQRRDTVEAALHQFTAEERTELARLLTKLADAWPS